MSRNRIACSIGLLVLASTDFAARADDGLVSYTIRRASSAIQIDGKLDETAWGRAQPVGEFQFPWWQEGRKEQTVARLLWDDQFLYVAYRCEDAHISAEHTERDSPVYRDDCVELFTSPNPDQLLKYFNIEMNVRGAFLDQYRTNGPGQPDQPDWNATGVRIATTIDGTLNDDTDTDRSWVLEAAIPFVNFQPVARNTPPRAGDVWRLNLNRLGGKTNPQFSQWSPGKSPKPQFHAPQYFGRVAFAE
jgi:hypothetical protein